jgi:hypothetical protein
MAFRIRRRALVSIAVLAIFALPGAVYAQEAVLTGTVSDSTGAVLPGVTITATHAATGNVFTGVTDDRGIYRISARVGAYPNYGGAPRFRDDFANR